MVALRHCTDRDSRPGVWVHTAGLDVFRPSLQAGDGLCALSGFVETPKNSLIPRHGGGGVGVVGWGEGVEGGGWGDNSGKSVHKSAASAL